MKSSKTLERNTKEQVGEGRQNLRLRSEYRPQTRLTVTKIPEKTYSRDREEWVERNQTFSIGNWRWTHIESLNLP